MKWSYAGDCNSTKAFGTDVPAVDDVQPRVLGRADDILEGGCAHEQIRQARSAIDMQLRVQRRHSEIGIEQQHARLEFRHRDGRFQCDHRLAVAGLRTCERDRSQAFGRSVAERRDELQDRVDAGGAHPRRNRGSRRQHRDARENRQPEALGEVIFTDDAAVEAFRERHACCAQQDGEHQADAEVEHHVGLLFVGARVGGRDDRDRR